MERSTAALAATLRGWGVRPGDRVASYMPNRPETLIAFLACASIGAVWSSCAPDMGASVVLDRLRQTAKCCSPSTATATRASTMTGAP
jgi:acetoacetyl-CoA synthetase